MLALSRLWAHRQDAFKVHLDAHWTPRILKTGHGCPKRNSGSTRAFAKRKVSHPTTTSGTGGRFSHPIANMSGMTGPCAWWKDCMMSRRIKYVCSPTPVPQICTVVTSYLSSWRTCEVALSLALPFNNESSRVSCLLFNMKDYQFPVPDGGDQSQGWALLAVCWSFLLAALATTVLRFYVRAKLTRNLGADDWTILAATVSNSAVPSN